MNRWRGAVYCDAPDTEITAWLVCAGIRQDGSGDDFYAVLQQECRTARQRYNAAHDKPVTTDTYSRHLLPSADDHDRYRIEAATRFALRLNKLIIDLIVGSLHDGHEHAVDLAGFRLGVQVRADDGHETYVAIRITGSVPTDLTAVILHRVPGCAPDGWFPESSLPERELMPAEQVWSNLMDPKQAARLPFGTRRLTSPHHHHRANYLHPDPSTPHAPSAGCQVSCIDRWVSDPCAPPAELTTPLTRRIPGGRRLDRAAPGSSVGREIGYATRRYAATAGKNWPNLIFGFEPEIKINLRYLSTIFS
ncbi:hypothetical protein [Nocardia sp. R6R-6]|uniref:hypothetical protein n=1 Tax=Nocardia sp. R6R-6 TaxID=3459303 RepID=UPI00403E08C0